jgi:predicted RecB family nuclease
MNQLSCGEPLARLGYDRTQRMPALAPIYLSKSRFIAGVQCLKRLYFQVRQPELADESDERQDARLEQGQEVGLLAQHKFPGGVLVGLEQGTDDALAKTAALMEDTSVPVIFEATFRHSNVLVRVDILQRRPGNRWRLIEVKSSVDFKDYHLYDVAIQYHILTACGLDISSACLMHLNRNYVHDGRQYDLRELFKTKYLTKQVRKLDADLPALLKAQRKALAQPNPPDISPGPQCTDPYQCEFFSHCNPEPPEHHISFLPRLSTKKQQALVELGVNLIDEIPDGFPLTELQVRVFTSVSTGKVWVSDTLRRELSKLKYPLYFMDFESVYPALPRFAGMWPYAQIPFQWSIHRQLEVDAELEHCEFLADDDQDPRRQFIQSLCEALGKRGKIIVYNATFESQRLGELADWLPEFRDRIKKIQERVWDLLPFVKRHVYHPQFNGSFSIKVVLPALVPDMTYAQMEVAHGEQAGLAWERMVRGGVDPAEGKRLKAALLAYCEMDTLAMVKILERLRGM